MISTRPIALGLLLLGTACAESEFTANSPQRQQTAADQTPDAPTEPAASDPAPVINTESIEGVDAEGESALKPEPLQLTQDFELKKEGSPIDMMWVIDNSGSMSEEVAQVRSNFANFMASISQRVDIQVTMLSGKSSTFGITLDPALVAQGHVQIEQNVGSTNLFLLAASALCPSAESSIPILPTAVGKVCNSTLVAGTPGVLIGDSERAGGDAVRGQMKNRLRENSKKVVVFVTDDNAQGAVNAANFLSLTKLKKDDTRIFAFRGNVSRPGCAVTRKGQAYDDLAAQTGGSVFDICDADWSSNFSKLSSSIIKLSSNSFSINAQGAFTVKKVLLDQLELSPEQYTLQGNKLSLKDQNLALSASNLHVIYEVQP